MALTREEVGRLARLARIQLTDAELDLLAPQLDQILEHVARVQEVATPQVVPTSHALPLENVFREDQVEPSLTLEQVLANAPSVEDDRFRVPRILGESA